MEKRCVIDFHSHILPQIDDGSKNKETTIAMLAMAKEQQVDIMVATPHFYADVMSIQRFLEERTEAYNGIKEQLDSTGPKILLGAEVAFFDGISKADAIEELTIEGTDLLLLEMPFAEWKESQIKEVERLVRERKKRVMLAHIERYFFIRSNKRLLKRLLELPVIVQINAEDLSERKLQKRILKMFAADRPCVMGSDCHSLHRRPPNLQEGRNVIAEKLGDAALYRIDEVGKKLICPT